MTKAEAKDKKLAKGAIFHYRKCRNCKKIRKISKAPTKCS